MKHRFSTHGMHMPSAFARFTSAVVVAATIMTGCKEANAPIRELIFKARHFCDEVTALHELLVQKDGERVLLLANARGLNLVGRNGILPGTFSASLILQALEMRLIPNAYLDGIEDNIHALSLLEQYGKSNMKKAMRLAGASPNSTRVPLREILEYVSLLGESKDSESAINKAKSLGYSDYKDVIWAANGILAFGFKEFKAAKRKIHRLNSGYPAKTVYYYLKRGEISRDPDNYR